MKLGVIAANGKVGQLVVQEALNRGHDVTAIVRGENRSRAPQALIKDLLSLTAEDLGGFDAVISAVGVADPAQMDLFSDYARHLTSVLTGSPTRLLIVGGASILTVDEAGTALGDTPDFPAEYKVLADAMRRSFPIYEAATDVNWTYVVPPADFQVDAPRTGSYTLGGRALMVNSAGVPAGSYADYAIAIVDEAERGEHVRELISVVSG